MENCSNSTVNCSYQNYKTFGTFDRFTITEFIVLAILLTILIVWVVLGNGLVLVAICRTKKLQLPSNFLIGNLAISDFLLGAVVLPFSAIEVILGWWPLSANLCNYWLISDVFICTSSIWSLLAIAMDRCSATFFPTWYRGTVQGKNRKVLLCYIIPIWGIAAGLCTYSFFGFKERLGGYHLEEDGRPVCSLFDECNFVIFSSVTTFYLPTFIMVIAYVKIYLELHKRNIAWERNRKSRSASRKEANGKSKGFGTGASQKNPKTKGDVQKDVRIDDSTCTSDLISRDSSDVWKHSEVPSVCSVYSECNSVVTIPSQGTGPSLGTVAESSDNENEDREPITKKPRKPNRFRASIASGTKMLAKISKKFKGSAKRKFEKKEQRATRITLCILICVIVCWMPFFSVYLLDCICKGCIKRLPVLYTFAFWLGYMNSAINPILYTVYNRNFREAFKQFLCWKPTETSTSSSCRSLKYKPK